LCRKRPRDHLRKDQGKKKNVSFRRDFSGGPAKGPRQKKETEMGKEKEQRPNLKRAEKHGRGQKKGVKEEGEREK